MSKTVTIHKSILIHSNVDLVWKISAHEFVDIHKWDANVKSSGAIGTPIDGTDIGGRVCYMYNRRETVEKLIKYDEESHIFIYEIEKGLPGFVENAQNIWTHQSVNSNKTKLTMQVKLTTKGILGTLMKNPMKAQMGRVLSNAQEELKYYIEHHEPHPRKKKKLATV